MTLAVVAHDAGGAAILATWLERWDAPALLVAEGPAREILGNVSGTLRRVDLDSALAEATFVLTGSSWQSDLEFNALVRANDLGVPTATYLDHWAHYRQRFERAGHQCLPGAIWVGDDEAWRLASAAFPGHPVLWVPNPWLEAVRERFSRETGRLSTESAGLRVLFVAEPLSEHGLMAFGDARHWGYTEFEALSYLLGHLDVLGTPVSEVVVRPHPAEARDKYDDVIRAAGPHVRRGGRLPLLDELAEADVVVGCESMAMVAGLVAGRKVLSAIPPGGRPCSLPHPGIESLAERVRTSGSFL